MKNSFHFQNLYMSDLCPNTHLLFIHTYIYMYIYIYTHTHTHIYIYICVCAHAKSLQSCPTLYDSMVYSPLGSSVHGILQTRLLEWVAMPSFRGSFWSRDQAHISYETTSLTSPALAGGYFTTSATWEAPNMCVCVCVCVYKYIYIYTFYISISHYIYLPRKCQFVLSQFNDLLLCKK